MALELLIKWVDNHLRAEGEAASDSDEIIYILCKIRRGSRTVWFGFLFFVIYNDLQNKVIRLCGSIQQGDPELAGPWAWGSAAAAGFPKFGGLYGGL